MNLEGLISAVDSTIIEVRTTSLDFSFNELAGMYDDGELIISPDFQRLFRWTTGAQSRFIESLLLELPVPPIFLMERQNREYELIDGLQRISSYLNFRGRLGSEFGGPLTLVDCDIIPELNGVRQEDLPRALDIKLKRSYIRAEILRKESDAHLRYYMFKRLNTGGERLSDQEVRNATIRILSNDFNDLLIKLSQEEDFKYCVDIISDPARDKRYEEELVLRYFAFKNNEAGYKHEYSDFMTEYMEAVSDPSIGEVTFDYAAEEQNFRKTFKLIRMMDEKAGFKQRIFGAVSLKKGTRTPRQQFSGQHFEGIALGIQSVIDRVDLNDQAMVERLTQVVKEGKFDQSFLDHTGGGKNDPRPLRGRIEFFEKKFREALDGS